MLLILAAMVVSFAVLSAIAYAMGMAMGDRGEPMRDWVLVRTRLRKPRFTPESRPIEEIAADLRRLGTRFHGLHPHASYAKVEAVRSAYDRTLDECCTALGLTHLLGVLLPGPQLDAERERVEEVLTDSGVRLPHPA